MYVEMVKGRLGGFRTNSLRMEEAKGLEGDSEV